ncbi:MAG: phage protease [Polyangiaceae bacterium]
MPPIIPLGGKLQAPVRFRIWSPGNNPGDYGDCLVNDAAIQRVMDRFNERGVALAIDYQHATNPKENPDLDPANPPPMAGYAVLKVVASPSGAELWVDPCRWSDCGRPNAVPGMVCCGRHQIESGQRNYVSPDWMIDPKTREPISIERLSLVAEPGTYGVNLLASRASANPSDRKLTMDDISILKALLAAAMGCAQCADSDCQAIGVDIAKQVSDFASSKGLDLTSSAPPSEATPVQAAACAPEEDKKNMTASKPVLTYEDVEKLVTERVNAALAQNVTAGKAISTEVRTVLSEESEKRALLEANKDVLGGMLPLLATKSLGEVKSFVAAANVTASKKDPKDGEAPRGPAIEEDLCQPVSIVDRYKNKK